SISGNGRYVAFSSAASNLVSGDTNNNNDIFVHDLVTGETSRVSVNSIGSQSKKGENWYPSISGDGRYVAFESFPSDLVPDWDHQVDVFLHDRLTKRTTLVSEKLFGELIPGDSDRPFLSADGRYVAFESWSSALVLGDTNQTQDVFLRGPELTLDVDPPVV